MSEATTPFVPWDNPMGTDGFEFIEYAAADTDAMGKLFERLGFMAVARHRRKKVTLYRQGEINFIVNGEPDSFAQRFARLHGPSICAIAFRVKDAGLAYKRAIALGAWGYDSTGGPGELNIPAIKGIGDSMIYLVDRWRGKDGAQPGEIGNISIYDVDFEAIPGAPQNPEGHGLAYIDHLTHNVHRGRMDEWSGYYERLFNFREVRYFDLEGQVTGIKSRAMTSPCGKIRIPINEEGQEKAGQIQEYLDRYHGEGVQHIAMGTANLYRTVDSLIAAGVKLLQTPATYYEGGRQAHSRARGAARRARKAQHPDRRRCGQAAAADLLREPVRSGVLRIHPAQRQRRIRRRQLQGAVRVDGARPDPPRRRQDRLTKRRLRQHRRVDGFAQAFPRMENL